MCGKNSIPLAPVKHKKANDLLRKTTHADQLILTDTLPGSSRIARLGGGYAPNGAGTDGVKYSITLKGTDRMRQGLSI